MKLFLSTICLVLIAVSMCAQPIYFESVWGGSGADFSRSVRQLSDGSIYVAGYSNAGTQGGNDFALNKLDRYGNLLWTKYYGDSLENFGLYMNTCQDGNFVLVGETTTPLNGLDIYYYKVDTSGTILWSKQYGTSSNESATHIVETSDGGFLLTGFNSDSFASNNNYILKVNSAGDFMWERSFGGTDNDVGMECHQTPEGDILFTGDTRSFGAGGYDISIAKLDALGNMKWNYYLGDTLQNGCQGILITSGNKYLSFGETETFPSSPYDFSIELLDTSGTSIWKKNLGGANTDAAYSAIETADGGFVFTGYSNSYSPGPIDVIVFKTDSSGNLLWTHNYGNASVDIGYEIIPSVYGGFLVTGRYFENDEQFYLLHLDSTGTISGLSQEETSFGKVFIYPNPFSGSAIMKLSSSANNELCLFDLFGKNAMIRIERVTDGFILHSENASPGIYFYRLFTPSPSGEGWGEVRSGKLVVQ